MDGRKKLVLMKKKLEYYSSYVLSHSDDHVPGLIPEILTVKGKSATVYFIGSTLTHQTFYCSRFLHAEGRYYSLLRALRLTRTQKEHAQLIWWPLPLLLSEKLLDEMTSHRQTEKLQKKEKERLTAEKTPKIVELSWWMKVGGGGPSTYTKVIW